MRLVKATWSALLTNAVDDEIVEVNVALQLGKLKGPQAWKLSQDDRDEKLRPLTLQEWSAFLEAAVKELWPPYAMAFDTMAMAGTRPGEAYAAQPSDLYVTAGTLRIERALDLDATVKPTKTYERRAASLSSSLVRAFKRYLVG